MRLLALLSMLTIGLPLLAACDALNSSSEGTSFPETDKDRRLKERGKITGEGLVIGGENEQSGGEGNNPLGVNSFLWRATLDTLAFMPLASADPFGGVIITDWYENAGSTGERFKVNAMILDRQLRADGIKVSLFKQVFSPERNGWVDQAVDDSLERKLEDTILTRARQLKIKNISQ